MPTGNEGRRERESHKKLRGYIFPFHCSVHHLFLIRVLCLVSLDGNIKLTGSQWGNRSKLSNFNSIEFHVPALT